MKDAWLDGYGLPDEADRERERPAVAPGKRTLTQRLAVRSSTEAPVQRRASQLARGTEVAPAMAPVQRRDDRAVAAAQDDPFALHLAAQHGVAGPSTALPFADEIQRAFGPAHDVSGIQAHIGGPAADASAAIGADAYATGDHVAFRAAPDLHTAAHEATHVIQQRAGVHLYGGVGEDGDAYERHADAVADRVVAGQSAADLLTAGPTSVATPAVQRRGRRDRPEAPAAREDTEVTAAVERVDLAVETLTIALHRSGSIDAPSAGLDLALDALASAIHRQQSPSRAEAAAVRAVLERVDHVIQQVGARHHSVHPTLDRKARALRERVGRVVAAAAETTRKVDVTQASALAAASAGLLTEGVAALRVNTGDVDAGVLAASRQASEWAAALKDPTTAQARTVAASAGRAIEQQYELAKDVVPRLLEVAAMPPSYSTGSALSAMTAALGASIGPRARAHAARKRADIAYQQWQLDVVKSSIEETTDSEATLVSMGQQPSGYSRSLTRRWNQLEEDAGRGQLDAGDLEELTVDADEVALFRNAQIIVAQCRQLERVLAELDGNKEVRASLREAADFTQSLLTKYGQKQRGSVSKRGAAAAELRGQLGRWMGSHHFLELLGGIDAEGKSHRGEAQDAIDTAQTAKTIASIAETIAITLMSMGVAAIASGAAEAVATRLGVRAATAARVGTAVGIVADVAFNTAAQKLVQHDKRSWLTLALINSAMVYAGKAIEHSVGKLFRIQVAEARFFGHFHITVAHVSADIIAGAAVDYAVSRAMGEEPAPPQTVADWLIAGATMGLTRGLTSHIAAVRNALTSARNDAFDRVYRSLSPRLAEAEAFAAKVRAAPSPEALAELHEVYDRLLAEEAAALDELIAHPDPQQANIGRTLAREHNKVTERLDTAVRERTLEGAGLPRDEQGGVHGDEAEVALAADTAERVGLDVAHDASDASAPRATIADGDRSVTVTQDRRTGRPPEFGPASTPAERAARARVIAAARRVTDDRAKANTAAASKMSSLYTRELQVGDGPQGSYAQGMQPTQWTQVDLSERIVLADSANPSVMYTQGDLRIGQPADALKGPGLPTDATATPGADFMTSAELSDAAVLGSLYNQAHKIDGRAIGPVEIRPTDAAGLATWEFKEAPVRRRGRLSNGHELMFYAGHVNDLSGGGIGLDTGLAGATDAATLAAGKEAGSIIDGTDPGWQDKVGSGGNVLAVPGNPSPDWNAEGAARRGNQVDLMGDLPPSKRAAFAAKIDAARASGDAAQLAAVRAEILAAAHPGLEIARNRAPGAAGDNPNVHVGAGRPKSVRRLDDGRYEVIFIDLVTGEPMAPRFYDQIIYGYGLSKASYFEETFGPHGEDGILEAVFYDEARTQFVGLRLPGAGYMVKGAAATTRDAAPWVRTQDRAAWLRAIDPANVKAGEPLFDGRPLTPDSQGVSGGIEMGRDRIGRGQVMVDRVEWKLPGDQFELTLSGDKSTWIEQVRRFVVEQLPAAPPDKVVVKARSGLSSDVVYEIIVDGQPLGIWKIFGWDGNARGERTILRSLKDAELKSVQTPKDRGAMGAAAEDGKHVGQSVLMDKMPGTSLQDLGNELAAADGKSRQRVLERFERALTRTAQGLAELHARYTDLDSTADSRRAGRKSDADYFVDGKLTNPAVIANLGGPENAAKIRAALKDGPYQRVLDADLPASAYHGDAHLGNFKVDHWNPNTKEWRDLSTFDLGTFRYGFPAEVAKQIQDGDMPPGAVGDKAAAGADLGRLLGSVDTLLPEGTLTSTEVERVYSDVIAAYQDAYVDALETRLEKAGRPAGDAARYSIDPDALEAVRLWSQVELEVTAAGSSGEAVARIGRLLNIELTSPAKKDGQ